MGSAKSERSEGRFNRHRRIRQRVVGTAGRPRLSVHRSLKQLYAQIIDDEQARTLVSISSLEKTVRQELEGEKTGLKRSRLLGKILAKRAKERGVSRVAFDRGGYLYHGHVKELADGARESGLEF